jgi:hypothetical protein
MKHIERSVDVGSTSARVWDVLVDFERYPEWNPFITAVSGRAVAGTKLKVSIRPPGGRRMTFRPRVLVAEPARELRWLGRVLVRGLFDGEHRFVIEPTGEATCRLVQSETFRGIFVPLFRSGLDATAAGFDAMNQALKARVESTGQDACE